MKASRVCRRCGLPSLLNRKGYCESCARLRWDQSIVDLRSHKGEFYERWKAAIMRRLEGGGK